MMSLARSAAPPDEKQVSSSTRTFSTFDWAMDRPKSRVGKALAIATGRGESFSTKQWVPFALPWPVQKSTRRASAERD